MAYSIFVLNVKYVIIVDTFVNHYVLNAPRKTVCPSPHLPDVAKIVWRFRNSTFFRNHLSNGVRDNSKSCDPCGQWFIGPVLDHVCNISYCSYCSNLSNQITSVLLK